MKRNHRGLVLLTILAVLATLLVACEAVAPSPALTPQPAITPELEVTETDEIRGYLYLYQFTDADGRGIVPLDDPDQVLDPESLRDVQIFIVAFFGRDITKGAPPEYVEDIVRFRVDEEIVGQLEDDVLVRLFDDYIILERPVWVEVLLENAPSVEFLQAEPLPGGTSIVYGCIEPDEMTPFLKALFLRCMDRTEEEWLIEIFPRLEPAPTQTPSTGNSQT